MQRIVALSCLITLAIQPAAAQTQREAVSIAAPAAVLNAPPPVSRPTTRLSRRTTGNLARSTYPRTHYQRGMYFRQKGEIDSALIEFLKATQENPHLVRAFYEQALIFRERGYSKLAESSLEQALAVDPAYQKARVLLATLRLEQGNIGGAVTELSRSLGIEDSKPASTDPAGRQESDRQSEPAQPESGLPAPAAPSLLQVLHSLLPLPPQQEPAPEVVPAEDQAPGSEQVEYPSGQAAPQDRQAGPAAEQPGDTRFSLDAILKGIPGIDPQATPGGTGGKQEQSGEGLRPAPGSDETSTSIPGGIAPGRAATERIGAAGGASYALPTPAAKTSQGFQFHLPNLLSFLKAAQQAADQWMPKPPRAETATSIASRQEAIINEPTAARIEEGADRLPDSISPAPKPDAEPPSNTVKLEQQPDSLEPHPDRPGKIESAVPETADPPVPNREQVQESAASEPEPVQIKQAREHQEKVSTAMPESTALLDRFNQEQAAPASTAQPEPIKIKPPYHRQEKLASAALKSANPLPKPNLQNQPGNGAKSPKEIFFGFFIHPRQQGADGDDSEPIQMVVRQPPALLAAQQAVSKFNSPVDAMQRPASEFNASVVTMKRPGAEPGLLTPLPRRQAPPAMLGNAPHPASRTAPTLLAMLPPAPIPRPTTDTSVVITAPRPSRPESSRPAVSNSMPMPLASAVQVAAFGPAPPAQANYRRPQASAPLPAPFSFLVSLPGSPPPPNPTPAQRDLHPSITSPAPIKVSGQSPPPAVGPSPTARPAQAPLIIPAPQPSRIADSAPAPLAVTAQVGPATQQIVQAIASSANALLDQVTRAAQPLSQVGQETQNQPPPPPLPRLKGQAPGTAKTIPRPQFTNPIATAQAQFQVQPADLQPPVNSAGQQSATPFQIATRPPAQSAAQPQPSQPLQAATAYLAPPAVPAQVQAPADSLPPQPAGPVQTAASPQTVMTAPPQPVAQPPYATAYLAPPAVPVQTQVQTPSRSQPAPSPQPPPQKTQGWQGFIAPNLPSALMPWLSAAKAPQVPPGNANQQPRVSAGRAPKSPQQPGPAEDPWTKRLRYLAEHGTASLKPGEAFMFSEETGEAVLFMPKGEPIRRQVAAPQDAEEVARTRRPDILVPQELQYNLSLLGKLLPKQSDNHAQQSAPADQLANFNVNEILKRSNSFWDWLKQSVKW